MRADLAKLKEEVARLLDSDQVSLVCAYQRAEDGVGSRPAFVLSKDDLEDLILDARAEACLPTLVYLGVTEDPAGEGKIAVVVKGCDSRAIERLQADHRLDRDRLVILGAPCEGIIDEKKLLAAGLGRVNSVSLENGSFSVVTEDDQVHQLDREEYLAEKCRACTRHDPTDADVMLGPEVSAQEAPAPDYSPVEKMEAMTDEERYAFWEAELAKCIRCYACRNVCPACNCRLCIFEQAEPQWAPETDNPSQHGTYQFTRAWHVAGRCVDCWECQRVCPAGIPLMLLNHKLMKDIGELFGVERPWESSEKEPLAQYSLEDPDDFE